MALRPTYRLRICKGCGEIDLYGVDCTNPKCSNYGGRLVEAVVEIILINGRKPDPMTTSPTEPDMNTVRGMITITRTEVDDIKQIVADKGKLADVARIASAISLRANSFTASCNHAQIQSAQRMSRMAIEAHRLHVAYYRDVHTSSLPQEG